MFLCMKNAFYISNLKNLKSSHVSCLKNVMHRASFEFSNSIQREITQVQQSRTLAILVQRKKIQETGKNIYERKLDGKRNNYLLNNKKRYFFEDQKTKSVTVWQGIKEVKSSPLPALVLGFSGLIPFISAPGYMILSQLYMPSIAFAQIAYGACILSFLGGVRWGIAIPDESGVRPDWFNLGYSVAPSLIAWLGLLLPGPFSILTVMTGLAVTAYFDTTMWGYPPWFKGLRFLLSLVAVLSLWTTCVCCLMLCNSKSETKSKEISNVEE